MSNVNIKSINNISDLQNRPITFLQLDKHKCENKIL